MKRWRLGCLGLVFLLGACATDPGVRVEGRVDQVERPPGAMNPVAGASISVDPVRVLLDDPAVNQATKDDLKPCADGRYPLEAQYADLTGDAVPEVLINVWACPSALLLEKLSGLPERVVPIERRLGGHVYTIRDGKPVALFATQERGGSVEQVGEGEIAALRAVYLTGDAPCCPTSSPVGLYRWDGAAFTEAPR
ncbi:hypothetical protein [Amycolatopsis nigrescens]|uniref:hypothetical protein n=1 Tax=Amycolatopsis nigrescens TaxID=381445 RepID=UPI00035FD22F|nr:hypothetical protein [Amycolatopsis nigrescens]